MKKVHTGLAGLLMLAVIVQFYLAATGAFDKRPTEEAFAIHKGFGYGIILLAVLVTIIGAVAKMGGRLIGLSGLVAALVVVQILIKEISKAIGDGTGAGPYIFGLHAVNGLLIMGTIGMILSQSRQISFGTQPAAQPSRPSADRMVS